MFSFLKALGIYMGWFSFCFIFLTLPLLADTLILKNKKVYKGRVKSQTEKSIVFKINEGQELTFQKKEVLKVIYKDLNEQEAKKIIQEEEKKIEKNKTELQKVEEPIPTKEEVSQEPIPQPSESVEKRTWVSIFWRSALVPGWGQWKAERKYTAGLAFLLTFGALGNFVSKVNALQSAESTYKTLATLTPAITSAINSSDPTQTTVAGYIYNQTIFSNYQPNIDSANQAANIFALVYALQLVHAYSVGREWEKEEIAPTVSAKSLKSWNFQVLPEASKFYGSQTYQFQFQYTFQF